jgi:hypothetical protein
MLSAPTGGNPILRQELFVQSGGGFLRSLVTAAGPSSPTIENNNHDGGAP